MATKSHSVLPHDPSTVRDQPRKRGKLPCGSRVCVRCHRGCGVVMAAYLSGLDELPEAADATSKKPEDPA